MGTYVVVLMTVAVTVTMVGHRGGVDDGGSVDDGGGVDDRGGMDNGGSVY